MFDPQKTQLFHPRSLYIAACDLDSKNQPFSRVIDLKDGLFLLFIAAQHNHYASVQIQITPFSLDEHPGQVFYSSTAHYKACCQDVEATAFGDALYGTAQRVYDSSFPLQCWNFSNKSCWKVLSAQQRRRS